MVFDLCVNGELGRYCGEHRPLPPDRAKTVFAELVDALTYLHERDIVHRDIKPENVFFDARWHAVLGDFGCAKLLERSAESGHRIRALSFVGSIGYVPPELLGHTDGTETSGVGLRADIFALGATAQVMCTGTPPFLHSDSSEFEVLSRVRHGKRRKPRAKHTDPDLLEVLDALLQHHAASRPPARRIALFRYFRGCNWPPDRATTLEPITVSDEVESLPPTPTRSLSLVDGSREVYAEPPSPTTVVPDDVYAHVADDHRAELQKSSVWAPFLRLRENEFVLITAPLKRRRNAHFFQLLLTSDHRMLLVRPEPRILKLSVYVDQVPMFEMTPPPEDMPEATATLTFRLANDKTEKQYFLMAVAPMLITDVFDSLVQERNSDRRGSMRSSAQFYSMLRRSSASPSVDAPSRTQSIDAASIGRMQEHIATDATMLLDKFRAEFDLTARDVRTKPRVLVAGCTGSGKSTLINTVFGRQVARVGGGVPVTQHFDRYELESESVVIYDSKGLEVGEHTNFMRTTKEFLEDETVEVHVVWYIINSAVSRIQPFEVDVCKSLFSKLPVIFILNKADLSSVEERESLRHSIREMHLANCVGVLDTSCAPTRSTAELPSQCSKCGSDDIEFRPKRKLVICAECGHVEQLVIQTGLDVLVSTTMDALPVLARERFVSAQQVSMSAKDNTARKIIADFHDVDFVHARLDRQQFNAVAKMLVRLSTVWEFREHSREYATVLAREHVGQYSLRDRVFLLMGRQDKRREATCARLTALGIVWHRCVRTLYTSILQVLTVGNKPTTPDDVETLVENAFRELREEAVERITRLLENTEFATALNIEIPPIGVAAGDAAAAAAAASATAGVATTKEAAPRAAARSNSENGLVATLVGESGARDASREASRSTSPDSDHGRRSRDHHHHHRERSVSPSLHTSSESVGRMRGDDEDDAPRRGSSTARHHDRHHRRHESPEPSLHERDESPRETSPDVDDDSDRRSESHGRRRHRHTGARERSVSPVASRADVSSPDDDGAATHEPTRRATRDRGGDESESRNRRLHSRSHYDGPLRHHTHTHSHSSHAEEPDASSEARRVSTSSHQRHRLREISDSGAERDTEDDYDSRRTHSHHPRRPATAFEEDRRHHRTSTVDTEVSVDDTSVGRHRREREREHHYEDRRVSTTSAAHHTRHHRTVSLAEERSASDRAPASAVALSAEDVPARARSDRPESPESRHHRHHDDLRSSSMVITNDESEHRRHDRHESVDESSRTRRHHHHHHREGSDGDLRSSSTAVLRSGVDDDRHGHSSNRRATDMDVPTNAAEPLTPRRRSHRDGEDEHAAEERRHANERLLRASSHRRKESTNAADLRSSRHERHVDEDDEDESSTAARARRRHHSHAADADPVRQSQASSDAMGRSSLFTASSDITAGSMSLRQSTADDMTDGD